LRRLITTTTVQKEAGVHEEFSLDYYVLQKEVIIESHAFERFGIEICKRARRSDGTPYIEYRKIFDLFHSEAEAIEVLKQMARNSVTPISMKDILEDMLGVTEFTGEELYVEAV